MSAPAAPPVLLPPASGLCVGPWASCLTRRPELVLVDDAVREDVASAPPAGARVVAVHGTADLPTVRSTAEAIEKQDPSGVLAVGGGATMDLAKLALLLAEHPGTAPRIERTSQRCGLVSLGRLPRRRHLTLVPTTTGTGSESSAGACFDHPWGADGERARSLVASPALAADHAVIDPALLTTLPDRLVIEGLVEALSRVLVPAVTTPSALEPCEWEAEALAAHLLALLDRLRSDRRPTEELLRAAALASSLTHRGSSLAGRGSAPSPVWFVATELSMVLGTRKNVALAALLEQWVALVRAGHEEWGDAERLNRLLPSASLDLGGLGLPTALDAPPHALERTTDRLRARWGGRLPMMGRFAPEQLDRLLAPVLGEAGSRD